MTTLKTLLWGAVIGALVGAIVGGLVFAAGIAHAGQTQHRPNRVTVTTPTHTYGFRCGRVQHPDPHIYVADNCRRAA